MPHGNYFRFIWFLLKRKVKCNQRVLKSFDNLNQINSAEYCRCKPANMTAYPTIKFKIQPTLFKPPVSLIFLPEHYMVPKNPSLDRHAEQECMLTLRPDPEKVKGRGRWILGSRFLLGHFSVYDLTENRQRIGLISFGVTA